MLAFENMYVELHALFLSRTYAYEARLFGYSYDRYTHIKGIAVNRAAFIILRAI